MFYYTYSERQFNNVPFNVRQSLLFSISHKYPRLMYNNMGVNKNQEHTNSQIK